MAAWEEGKNMFQKSLKKSKACFGKWLVVTLSERSRPDESCRFHYEIKLYLRCVSAGDANQPRQLVLRL